jgi:hypothetical protein
MITVINKDEIPPADEMAPGVYCCRLDESSTLAGLRVRAVIPLREHVPGDCLVQLTKADS